MGRQLLADEPAFAAAVAELEPVFVEQVGFSLQQVLADGEPVSGDARVQPVLMGLQLALTELWRSYGVHPDAVIGHSMGEVTAAVVAGALTVAEGLRVIATRSRLMSRLAGQGAMALLELDAEATEALIADYPEVTVAVYASPRQTVIAGPPEQVDAVIAAVTAQNRFARRVEHGGRLAHRVDGSDPARIACGAGRSGARDRRRFRSSPPSPRTPPTPLLDADYWVANVRQPVRFSQAIAAAARRPHHLHRDQPAPAAHPRHQRHPGVGDPSPQRRARCSATLTTPSASTPTSTPPTPTQPPRHAAPTRTAPRPAHHSLAPHPPLDRHHSSPTRPGRIC